jgi:heat shock protein HslJ
VTRGAVTLVFVSLALFLQSAVAGAASQFIRGAATCRERVTLPRGAVLEAALEEVTSVGGKATTMATTSVTSLGSRPMAFTIPYDPARIVATHQYRVRARVVVDGRVLLASDADAPVITQGSPREITLVLRPVTAGQAPAPLTSALGETYWRAIDVAGHPVPARGGSQEAHLQFLAAGRVAGADGCNRLTGGYALNGDAITFSDVAATRMVCPPSAVEDGFRDALKRAARWAISGTRLELLDATRSRLAVFEARAPAPVPVSSVELEGTAWKLVRFQGGDDAVVIPDDGSKYTVQFEKGGRLAARIDCNRGRGTWKSNAPNQLEVGPLALTRTRCPAGSLHNQIVKNWRYIWSFVIRDGHLFMTLTADRGTYEWAPHVPDNPPAGKWQKRS